MRHQMKNSITGLESFFQSVRFTECRGERIYHMRLGFSPTAMSGVNSCQGAGVFVRERYERQANRADVCGIMSLSGLAAGAVQKSNGLRWR
jgi:hypothetical protein